MLCLLQGGRSTASRPTSLQQILHIHIHTICCCITETYRVFQDLWTLLQGGDFLGLCDQNISYKHVSDFGRLRCYGHFLIPIHALVWTASYWTSWRVMYSVAYRLLKLRRATHAVHNRAAASVAAGGGIFENQL